MAGRDFQMTVYNVSEAKRLFTSIRHEALEGRETLVVSQKRQGKDAPISVIATSVIDELCERFPFTYVWSEDKEVGGWTVYCPEVMVYGEGDSREEAIKDFLANKDICRRLGMKKKPGKSRVWEGIGPDGRYRRTTIHDHGDSVPVRIGTAHAMAQQLGFSGLADMEDFLSNKKRRFDD